MSGKGLGYVHRWPVRFHGGNKNSFFYLPPICLQVASSHHSMYLFGTTSCYRQGVELGSRGTNLHSTFHEGREKNMFGWNYSKTQPEVIGSREVKGYGSKEAEESKQSRQ